MLKQEYITPPDTLNQFYSDMTQIHSILYFLLSTFAVVYRVVLFTVLLAESFVEIQK